MVFDWGGDERHEMSEISTLKYINGLKRYQNNIERLLGTKSLHRELIEQDTKTEKGIGQRGVFHVYGEANQD